MLCQESSSLLAPVSLSLSIRTRDFNLEGKSAVEDMRPEVYLFGWLSSYCLESIQKTAPDVFAPGLTEEVPGS